MVNESIGWALRPNATGKARATLGFALLYSGGRGGERDHRPAGLRPLGRIYVYANTHCNISRVIPISEFGTYHWVLAMAIGSDSRR